MLPAIAVNVMPALTKRLVSSAPQKAVDYFLWCSTVPGFGVRIYPSGKRVFVCQVRVGRATRRVKIGAFGPYTVEQARQRAQEIVRAASEGRDPQREKCDARVAITVSELCDNYLEAARAGLVMTRFRQPKRGSTLKIDEGRIARHIKPLIGSLRARDVTRGDVQRMADAIAQGKTAGVFRGRPRGKAIVRGGPASAARVVSLLGGIYSWAEKRGLIVGRNPVRGIETVQGVPKERTLSPEELCALGKVLDEHTAPLPGPVAAVRIIALTGLRREEVCGLRWAEIDTLGSCLRLERTKTGRSVRPVGSAALEVLQSIARVSDNWVFPNSRGTASADFKKTIARLFNAAGLHDARSHDLRRTFGSVAADEGYGDTTIAELLGHARRGVTARHYIRRPDAALISAADRVCLRIAMALSSKRDATGKVHLREVFVEKPRNLQASAVTAALGLLRKIMPDLQSVDMKGKVEGDVRQYSDAELMAIIAASSVPIAEKVEMPLLPASGAPEGASGDRNSQQDHAPAEIKRQRSCFGGRRAPRSRLG
jgi:integrase